MIAMDKKIRYRNDYEEHPPYKVYFHKKERYHFYNERFVVPWQMDHSQREEVESE